MARLIADGGPLPLEPDSRGRPPDVYGALLRTITGQQLSVTAARAIHGRLLERFGGRPPTPEEILADDPDALRTAAGLSRAKTASLRSLAEHVLGGELQLTELQALPDEDVIRELVAVKGIGEWTAHMFLMFTLHRPDVLADQRMRFGDVRRDLIKAERAAVLGLRNEGKVSQDIQRLIERDLDLEEARLR